MESTIERIEQELKTIEQSKEVRKEYDLEQLKKKFKSEQTEVWAAASIKLGDLIFQCDAVKNFIAIKIIGNGNITEKEDIHGIRHAFNALTVHAAKLKRNGNTEQWTLLDNFGNLINARPVEVELTSYFESLLWHLEKSGKERSTLERIWNIDKFKELPQEIQERLRRTENGKEYTTEELEAFHKQYKDKEISKKNSIKKKAYEELAVLREEHDALKESQKHSSTPLKKLEGKIAGKEEHIAGLENAIKKLEDSNLEDLSLADYYKITSLSSVLDKQKAKYDSFINQYNLNSINAWIISSLMFSLDSLYEAYRAKFDFFWIILSLISKGEVEIAYIKNVPFLLRKLLKEDEARETLNIDFINTLLEKRINEPGKIDVNVLHFGDFLKDFDFYHYIDSKKKGKSKFLSLLNPYIPEEYRNIDKSEYQVTINKIAGFFADEFTWKILDNQHQNLIFLYEYLISRDTQRKPREKLSKYITLVYRDLLKVISNNNYITLFLLRILKKLMYEERKIYLIDKKVKAHKFFKVCEKEILMVLPIIKEWDWCGVIEKDAATILVNTIEDFIDKNEAETEPFLVGVSEDPVQRLMYYVFLNLPSRKILKEMCSYSRCKSFYSQYLSCFDEKENEDVAVIQKVYSPFNICLNYLSGRDLSNSSHFFANSIPIKTVFKWKCYIDLIMKKRTCYFFRNFEENEQFLLDFEERCQSMAEVTYNEFMFLMRDYDTLINEINLKYTETEKYQRFEIDVEKINFEGFKQLMDKLQHLLVTLGKIKNTIITMFPLYERELVLGSNQTQGLYKLIEDCYKERDTLAVIMENFINEEEDSFFFQDQEKDIKGEQRDLREKYTPFIQKWFFSRFAFKLLLSPNVEIPKSEMATNEKKEGQTELIENKFQFAPGQNKRFLNLLYNPFFALGLIFGPFILFILDHYLGTSYLGEWAYWFIVSAIFPFLIIWGIIDHRDARRSMRNESSEHIHYTNFLMPKMLAMIFVAYGSMYFADELWAISIMQSAFLGTVMIAIFLFFTFLILNKNMFANINLRSSKKKFSRITSIVSLGLLQSYLLNLFNALILTRKMTHPCRANFDKFLKAFDPEFFHNSVFSAFLQWMEGPIYPYLIIIWTFQTFCIGVIIQMFIQKDDLM